MGWVALIIALMVISACMESKTGKIILSAGMIALGCLLLDFITGMDLFITLAKLCAVVIVVVIVGVVILAIIGGEN